MQEKYSDLFTVSFYDKYKVRKDISNHCIYAAAIAFLIYENLDNSESTNRDRMIKVCLLHDVGNILRKNFFFYPKFSEPEGEGYWRDVLKDFRKKYGDDEDVAVLKIAKEINLDPDTLKLLEKVILEKVEDQKELTDLEFLICKYADTRSVHYAGVVSVDERVDEWAKRNKDASKEFIELTRQTFYKVESEIFSRCKIKPTDINQKSIEPYFNIIKNYKI